MTTETLRTHRLSESAYRDKVRLARQVMSKLARPQKQLERAAGRGTVAGAIYRLHREYVIAKKSVNEIYVHTGRDRKRAQHTVYIYLVLDLILRICFVASLCPSDVQLTADKINQMHVGRRRRRRHVVARWSGSVDGVAGGHVPAVIADLNAK